MRIFGWAADNAGCAHYRLRLPLGQLAAAGHDVRIAERFGLDAEHEVGQSRLAGAVQEWLGGIEILVGQRVCLPGPTERWQRIARFMKRPALVYETDDDLLNVSGDNEAGHAFYGMRADVRERIVANMRVADLVAVSTEPLADVARRYNRNVVVLPNCIDEQLLTLPIPDGHREPGRTYVGWGGSPTHAVDFAEAAPQLRRLLRDHPAVTLRLLGTAYMDGLGRSSQIQFAQWTEDMRVHYERVAAFHIGIAPLRPSVFNQSKSHIKALEYAALGVPAVVSDLLPYQDFVRHGETGYLVRRDHEWLRYLRHLVADEPARTAMGHAARAHAAQWTTQANAWRWKQAYSALLGRPTISGERAESLVP